MMSCNWFTAFKRIALTLTLALTLASTFNLPTPLPHPILPHPQVNWNS